MAGIMMGLNFDLSSWRRGVKKAGAIVKKGLDGEKATGGLRKGLKKVQGTAKKSFRKIGGFMKSAFSSGLAPLLGLLAGGAILAGMKKVLSGSLAAFRNYQDSITTLNAALKTTGETNLEGAREEVEALGEQLRLTMGIAQADTNNAFSNFITRGFDRGQAEQLTVLAANFAKKTGKPIEDVQKVIADAANGSVDAMKELGIEITATGNRVADGNRAVLAMKDAYGDIGSDLVNPSEQLNANLDQLRVMLGERISPLLEPLIQGVSDFVAGLTQTEEGREYLDQVAGALEWIINNAKALIVNVSNLVEMVKAGGKVMVGLVEVYINGMAAHWLTVADKILSHPFMQWLFGKMGLDTSGVGELAEGFREGMMKSIEDVKSASSDFMRAQGEFMRGESDTGIVGGFNSMREAGAAAKEQAAADLQGKTNTNLPQGFAGRPAQEAEAAKQKQEVTQRRVQQSQQFVGDMGNDVEERVALSIQLKSKGPQRFRKARFN